MTTELQTRVAARIANDFDGLDVSKYPLTGPENSKTNLFGLWTEKGDYVEWSAHSAGYVPHTVDDVSVMAEAVCLGMDLSEELNITTKWTGRAHRVIIGPTNEQRRTICGTADDVFPRVVISAGFAGEGFKVNAGFYRDACSNLSMLRMLSGTQKTIRHTGGMRGELHRLAEQFRSFNGIWDQEVDLFEQLAAREVRTADFLTQLYPMKDSAPAATVTRFRNRAEQIIDRIIRERRQLNVGDPENMETASLWELVNGITGYIQHDKGRKDSENLTAIDRAFIGFDDTDADKAWKLADEMLAA